MLDPNSGQFRKLRRAFNEQGHAHELTFSCYKRLPLLSRDRTRRWFIEAMDAARRRWDFELWAYVIMPEHAHALLFPRSDVYNISDILKAIKQPVARQAIDWLRANAKDWLRRLQVVRPGGRVEYHFWQEGGGYDRNIFEPGVAWASADYLHMNPVRRKLVTVPTDWRWSSARCYAGLDGVELAVDDRPPDLIG
jgi:putative transposase